MRRKSEVAMRVAGWLCGVAVAALACTPGTARAQLFTPTFMAPQPGGDVGIYLSDEPRGFSLEGIWRRNFGGYDLGFRGGVISVRDDTGLLIGAEFRNPLAVDAAPLALAFTGGLQAILADRSAVGFQAGLSFGAALPLDQLTIVPYIHPRLALLDRGRRDDGFDLDVLADLGFDFVFRPNLTLRFAIGLSDPTSDWGIGIAWR